MTEHLEPYAVVRICQLLQPIEDYNSWCQNFSPPSIGETGTLIDILTATGYPNKFVVERCAADGTTVWLSDFFAEELELVQPYPA